MAIVCGGLLWLVDSASGVSAAARLSSSLGWAAAAGTPADRAAWTPLAPGDDESPISPDDDDEDGGDPDLAIAEPLSAPDLSEHSFALPDVSPGSARALVSRSLALRAPPISTF